MTSLLVDATYVLKKDGTKEMFRHAEKIAKSEKLTKMFENGFVRNCRVYESPLLFVACGPGVYNVLKKLQKEKIINSEVVGIAHPSGANLGRIMCYLGKVDPKDASYQWCIEKAQEARKVITIL